MAASAPPPAYNEIYTDVVYVPDRVRPKPTKMKCPSCHMIIVSKTRRKPGIAAWVWCSAMFFVELWPCCWVPLCMKECQDVHHSCPNCGAYLGRHRAMLDG
ncbi:LITAF-like zinc ribbon domain-containing protein [Ditylenchus destructor]|nr:LITAF-like zinc ribbon domain-containing protein [Ditylenchus destructor]